MDPAQNKCLLRVLFCFILGRVNVMLVFIIVEVRKAKLCVVLEKQLNYLATSDCLIRLSEL